MLRTVKILCSNVISCDAFQSVRPVHDNAGRRRIGSAEPAVAGRKLIKQGASGELQHGAFHGILEIVGIAEIFFGKPVGKVNDVAF